LINKKMKAQKPLKEIFIVLVTIAPLLYYFYLWSSLPETIPIHFDAIGNPNGYGSKNIITIVLLILTVGIYLFLKFIPRVYNKNSFTIDPKTFENLRFIMALFFSTLCFMIIFSVQQGKINSSLLYIIIAFLISILGNYMGNVRPNNLFKNKFKWTNKDEFVWKKTQNFIGKLWFVSGIALALIIIFLPKELEAYVLFIGMMIILVILPAGYSYIIYLNNKKALKRNELSETLANTVESESRNSDPWIGLFYVNSRDKRVLVPKRTPGMGWTLNFGNPYAYILLIAIVLIILMTNYLT
ncbi:MAG: DUF1648 domain-containing protein, partial [Bacteroidetes bacterium]|nr:DUF1648 domain-containing protein [Bacteroidota bacterium]